MDPILLGVRVKVRRASLARAMFDGVLRGALEDEARAVIDTTAERDEVHLAELRARRHWLVLAVTGRRERIARLRDITAVRADGDQIEIVLRDKTSCGLPCRIIDPAGPVVAAMLQERLGLPKT